MAVIKRLLDISDSLKDFASAAIAFAFFDKKLFLIYCNVYTK